MDKVTYTPFRSTAVTNSATSVRADKATLFGWNIINQHSAAITVKLYDALAAGVVVGTTTPALSVNVPANGTAVLMGDTRGFPFETACSVAVTTESADNGTTAAGTLPIISLFID